MHTLLGQVRGQFEERRITKHGLCRSLQRARRVGTDRIRDTRTRVQVRLRSRRILFVRVAGGYRRDARSLYTVHSKQ